MRDGSIMQMQRNNQQRDALILRQLEFLQTRQEAVERVLLVSKLRDRLGWIWNPARMAKLVDAVQMGLIQERRQQAAQAAAKPKIVMAPGGVLVG